jgi:hypothetical protein
MRQDHAAEIVALDVFDAAHAAGEPVTMGLVRRIVAELLTHRPECACDAAKPPRQLGRARFGVSRQPGRVAQSKL